MKAVLEFDLNDPDDQNRFEICNKALDMGLILWEIKCNKKRSMESQTTKFEAIDYFYDWLNEELFERGINIENLIQ